MTDAGCIVVELAGAPQGQGRPRTRVVNTRRGKSFATIYTPPETRRYEEALQSAARAAMGSNEPLEGPLSVTIYAYMPIPQSWSTRKLEAAKRGDLFPTVKPDWDNIGKSCDALKMVVWVDDTQVVDGRVIKLYSEHPKLRIEVRQIVVAGATPLIPSRVDPPFAVPA